MDKKSKPALNEHEMWLDGKYILVHLEPEDEVVHGQGVHTNERVRVRKVPFGDLDTFTAAWGKFGDEVACYCARPLRWVKRLTDDSFSAAFQEGRRLNFT